MKIYIGNKLIGTVSISDIEIDTKSPKLKKLFKYLIDNGVADYAGYRTEDKTVIDNFKILYPKDGKRFWELFANYLRNEGYRVRMEVI